jgi:hypothetical protein
VQAFSFSGPAEIRLSKYLKPNPPGPLFQRGRKVDIVLHSPYQSGRRVGIISLPLYQRGMGGFFSFLTPSIGKKSHPV